MHTIETVCELHIKRSSKEEGYTTKAVRVFDEHSHQMMIMTMMMTNGYVCLLQQRVSQSSSA